MKVTSYVTGIVPFTVTTKSSV